MSARLAPEGSTGACCSLPMQHRAFEAGTVSTPVNTARAGASTSVAAAPDTLSSFTRTEASAGNQPASGDCKTSLSAASLRRRGERKSVVEGKSVSVRVDLGGRRIIKKKQRIDK